MSGKLPIFCQEKNIYFEKPEMISLLNVIAIVCNKFSSVFRQFMDSVPKKVFRFRGDPIIEPIFDFFAFLEPLLEEFMFTSTEISSNLMEPSLVNTAGDFIMEVIFLCYSQFDPQNKVNF